MNEYSYQEHHMGTTVSLSFVCRDHMTADTMANYAFTIIKDYEEQFSRFLPQSELSRLNQRRQATVSDIFLIVLTRSLELHQLTQGNFNPLLQVQTLGYNRNYAELASATARIIPSNYDTDVSQIQIDKSTNLVVLSEQQQLDFGGLIKGYLAAEIANTIMKINNSCTGCIINIGGDLATRGYDELHQPFIFYLYNPITGIELPITVKDQSLATSGTYARKWRTSHGLQNHIVDSHTRQNPTTGLVAVSIVAQDGALTEALTKLFLTRGIEAAITIASPQNYHYQYFTVSNAGEIMSNLI